MGYVLHSPYAENWEAFLSWIQPRVTGQGYDSIRKTSYQVLKWLEYQGILPEELTIRDAQRYKQELSETVSKEGKPLSTGTIVNRIKAGRTLYKFLVLQGVITTNPFMEIKHPKMGDHISRNHLTEVQMGYLLGTLGKFDTAPTVRERLGTYRLHVMAEFLYATGLRIAEAASLIPSNIDTKSRLVYVPEGKGTKSRTAFMTAFAAEVMQLYLSRGREAVFGPYGRGYGRTVFGAHPQRIMAVLNEGLRKHCAELQLPVISSHAFRYSLGTHLLRAGCDMRYIQVILGHESISTTQIYTRVDKDDLKASIDRFHPRKWGMV